MRLDPSESQTVEQVIAHLDKLEAQLHERFPPLEQNVTDMSANLAAIAKEMGSHIHAFKTVDATVTQLVSNEQPASDNLPNVMASPDGLRTSSENLGLQVTQHVQDVKRIRKKNIVQNNDFADIKTGLVTSAHWRPAERNGASWAGWRAPPGTQNRNSQA